MLCARKKNALKLFRRVRFLNAARDIAIIAMKWKIVVDVTTTFVNHTRGSLTVQSVTFVIVPYL